MCSVYRSTSLRRGHQGRLAKEVGFEERIGVFQEGKGFLYFESWAFEKNLS